MDEAEHKSSLNILQVTSPDSHEFFLFQSAIRHSSIVALDAEWKPNRSQQIADISNEKGSDPTFPTVTLLQIACRIRSGFAGSEVHDLGEYPVFLVDMVSVPLSTIWELLGEMFVSRSVLKLGFRFKQDLVYLSSTFSSQGFLPGFDKVEPFIDITSIYYHMKYHNSERKFPKDTVSLANICGEILNISLSKELQCSDWSRRPLTEGQISYAAADAYYLLEIFAVFEEKYLAEGIHTMISDEHILDIVNMYGEKIILKESDRQPRVSRRRERKQLAINTRKKDQLEVNVNWQDPPPWDPVFGGDGCTKFLCDVMVEGLARHLRCVGIDAAVPPFKKPDPRQLMDQAYKEKRVLLTRDAKLRKYQYLSSNQVYRVKSLMKNEQLLEVIETFKLNISEEQLMSRCTKCNGSFIQKPLTLEEAIEASKGFQIIPNCLFDREIEFWQCLDCRQLYWEGTQYRNAVEKFVNICKLST